MKRLLSLAVAIIAAVTLLCGCEVIHSPFMGTWVCQDSVENYPERLILGTDGFGTVDDMECEWAENKSRSELTLLVDSAGEFRYRYAFLNHATLYLNDVEYRLQE